MTSRKPVSWFLTDRGRNFSLAVIGTTGIGCTIARFVPNTLLLEKYKNTVHYYSNGKPVQLSQELSDRCSKCLDILKMPDMQRKLIAPFSVFGFDLFHAGTTFSKFGVAVGIPVNFSYKSLEDLAKDDILVNQKKVDWTSETGQKLADSLILPEKVQQFAICREILMSWNNKVIYESIYPFACMFFAYTASQYLNNKMNLYKAPTLIRAFLYSITGSFALGMYFLMKDMTEVHFETKTDITLCELGPEFVESGVIFYDKILKRNQALRELMGREGQKKYSVLGNENFGLRQPRLALVHRKQFFEDKLKELQDKGSEDQVPNIEGEEK